MENERRRTRPGRPLGGGSGDGGNPLDEVRDELEGILDAADATLESLGPVNAEDYLAQNRQRGGE